MVMDILRERDQGGFGDRNEYGSRVGGGIDVSPWGGEAGRGGPGWALRGSPGPYFTLCLPPRQVPVPRHSVGVVIGRSGEMIKKIQNDAGVRIQFKQGEEPPLTAGGWGWDMGRPLPAPSNPPAVCFGQTTGRAPRRSPTSWAPPSAANTPPASSTTCCRACGYGGTAPGWGWGWGADPGDGEEPGAGGPKIPGGPKISGGAVER